MILSRAQQDYHGNNGIIVWMEYFLVPRLDCKTKGNNGGSHAFVTVCWCVAFITLSVPSALFMVMSSFSLWSISALSCLRKTVESDHWFQTSEPKRLFSTTTVFFYIKCLYLVLLRCGEPGLDEESSLLAVSIRKLLLWSCFPADDRGLFTAPKTFADLGLGRKRFFL